MPKEFLGDRKKALEDSFFSKQNKTLLERMREEKRHAEAREGLRAVAGISDDTVLDHLTDLDIEPHTWAAVALVPLVEVAWADGKVEEKERRAVISAAEANGIDPGTPSYQLLENWLAQRPSAALLQAWGEYIVALCAQLDEPQKLALRNEIMGRARAVAESTGGILGLLNKVSPEEEVILAELAKSFER